MTIDTQAATTTVTDTLRDIADEARESGILVYSDGDEVIIRLDGEDGSEGDLIIRIDGGELEFAEAGVSVPWGHPTLGDYIAEREQTNNWTS